MYSAEKNYISRQYKVAKHMVAQITAQRKNCQDDWMTGFFTGVKSTYQTQIEYIEEEFPWLVGSQECENILSS